ncbi:MAG: hypothetical protein LUI08_06040 [Prevotella sp.]|nr:hypothetical protein [Prevotella sp.]MCD8305782.1 hypothetical protein [Prevotella sp.]
MALHYTRKHDENDNKTVNSEEFINLMLDNKRIPDARRKEDTTEMPK